MRMIRTLMPAGVVAALSIGLAIPAAADVPPKRERKTRTLEPQHAPEMTPPLEQPAQPEPPTQPEQPTEPTEPEPPSQPTTPSTETTPEAAPSQDASKTEPPKAEAKSATDEKTGSCSIDDGSEQDLAGLAALALLLCGASLRRRRG